MCRGHGDFCFSELLPPPRKVHFKPDHFKTRPRSAWAFSLLCTSVAVPFSRNEVLSLILFQCVFLKIRVLCKIIVGLSSECKVKWELAEHHCAVLRS